MNKFIKKTGITFAIGAALLGSTAAIVRSGTLPIVNVPLFGGTIAEVRPSLDLSWDEFALSVSISGTADLSQMQKEINTIASSFNHASRCDLAYDVSNMKLAANRKMINITFDGHIQQNWCTYVERPKLDGWRFKMVREIWAEGMYFSQSGHIALDCWLTSSGKSVTPECKIVTADASGLLGKLKLAGTLKSKLTKAVNTAFTNDKMKFVFPEAYQPYDINIKTVSFVNLGEGKLGLDFSLKGKLTGSQFWSLVQNYVGIGSTS